MERGVAASEPMGPVLNRSGLLAQPLEQHSRLDSSDVRHEPLSMGAMESPLLLNKNDGKQLGLLANIHQATQWKEVSPRQSLWGQCSTAVDYLRIPWSSTLASIVQTSVTNICPKEQWNPPLFLNKNDGKQLGLLTKINHALQWKEVSPRQSLWGR